MPRSTAVAVPFREVVDMTGLVRAVHASFAPNELAYLALTGSPELTLRDRLAWQLQLHPGVGDCGWVVARGHPRIDVAVLRADGSAAAGIAVATAYTLDAILPTRQAALQAHLRSKVEICAGRSFVAASDSYVILAMVNPLARIPAGLFACVRQAAEINALFIRGEGGGIAATLAETELVADTVGRPWHRLAVPTASGSAFRIDVEVRWYTLRVTRAT